MSTCTFILLQQLPGITFTGLQDNTTNLSGGDERLNDIMTFVSFSLAVDRKTCVHAPAEGLVVPVRSTEVLCV